MDQEVSPDGGTGQQVPKLVVDGLLCCIAKALSRDANHAELTAIVDRECNELEVKSSWVKLFEFYHDAYDAGQKKFIKDINRQTSKNRIVNQLGKADKQSDFEFLVMPWNYSVIDMKTDSEKLSDIIVQEKVADHEARFEAFEKKMDKKHSDLCSTLKNLMQEFIAGQVRPTTNASFASVVGGQHGIGTQLVPGAGSGTLQHHSRVLQQQTRGRSPSVKRPRADDGNDVVSSAKEVPNKPQKTKAVVGTSDKAGRKMKSPPADIFVWGVHPDTSIDDIVNDLAESNIVIKATDVEKKSKEEAYLCSYRISVPAGDLQKALDPAIWPLRVKVREFVHYAKRNPRPRPGSGGEQGVGGGDGHVEKELHHARVSGAQFLGNNSGGASPKTINLQLPVSNVPLKNMFELLSQLGTPTL